MADVDVLLAFHRNDEYLRAAAESVQRQRGVNTRIIFIDDRPLEQRREQLTAIVRASDVLLSTPEGSQGYGQALCIGSAAIDSSAIALMNSDDISASDRFMQQLPSLNQADLSIARMQKFCGDRAIRPIFGEIDFRYYNPAFLLLGAYGADATWCMRREWWMSQAFFDARPVLDWRIALSSFLTSNVAANPNTLYYYRQHDGQATRTGANAGGFEAVRTLWFAVNSALGLSELSTGTAAALAVPWETCDQRPEPDEISVWTDAFCELLEAPCQSVAREMIGRRSLKGCLANGLDARTRLSLATIGAIAIPTILRDLAVNTLSAGGMVDPAMR